MGRGAWFAIAAAAGAVLVLAAAGDPVAAWFATHRSHLGDDLLEPYAALGQPIAPLLIGSLLAGLGLLFEQGQLLRPALRVTAGGLLAAATVALLRLAHVPVSLEAAVAMAMAAAFFDRSRLLAVAVCALAALTATERLYVAGEAPWGVAAGLSIGVACGALAERRAPRLRENTATLGRTAPGAALGMLALLLPIVFYALGARSFSDPDEGRYAAIPYEMLVRHDFVTPTLNHLPYFEKPPLLYWAVAFLFHVFGPDEGAARLVPALAASLGVVVAYLLGRRMFGARAGTISAGILATSLMWSALGRFLSIDMLFSSLVFAALATWWCGHSRPDRRRGLVDALFWLLVGLAFLAKGPVAVVLVCGSIGLYALLCGQLRDVFRPAFLALSLLAAALVAPWFVLVSQANPGFDQFFWYQQHFGRFLGFEQRGIHEQPVWFFGVYLPPMFLPWTALVPAALITSWRRLRPSPDPRTRATVFLASGMLFVTLFFTASAGKLQVYALPVLPLAAVALGGFVASAAARTGTDRAVVHARRGAVVLAGLFTLLSIAALVAGPRPMREIEARGPGLIVVLSLLLAGWAAALFAATRKGGVTTIAAALAGGSATLLVVLAGAAHLVVPNHTFESLADHIRPGLDAGADVFAYRGWIQSSSFYTRRRIEILNQGGEFEYGLGLLPEWERDRWYGGDAVEAAATLLATPEPVYCIVRDHEQAGELLPRLGEGVREIIWNRRRSIVGNAAAVALTPPREGGLMGERWEWFK